MNPEYHSLGWDSVAPATRVVDMFACRTSIRSAASSAVCAGVTKHPTDDERPSTSGTTSRMTPARHRQLLRKITSADNVCSSLVDDVQRYGSAARGLHRDQLPRGKAPMATIPQSVSCAGNERQPDRGRWQPPEKLRQTPPRDSKGTTQRLHSHPRRVLLGGGWKAQQPITNVVARRHAPGKARVVRCRHTASKPSTRQCEPHVGRRGMSRA